MKFNEIVIRPNINRKCYTVGFRELKGEYCARPKAKPRAAGWYVFPAKMPIEQAFSDLKDCMIADAMGQIEALTKSIQKLTELKCPNIIYDSTAHEDPRIDEV